MNYVYVALLFLHLLSWAIIVGGWIATLKKPGLYAGVPHAALTALVTGILMVGVTEMQGDGGHINYAKIIVKLVVNLVVVVLAFRAKKLGDEAPRPLIMSVGALTVLNILLALFWSGRHL